MTGAVEPEIGAFLAELRVVDHHVHSCLSMPLDRAAFETLMSETAQDIPSWMTQFDSQVGFAVRKYCAPVLGLDEHADADTYWRARSELPAQELVRLLLGSSGVSDWLIDTGVIGAGAGGVGDGEVGDGGVGDGGVGAHLFGLDALAGLSGQRTHEIVRLETVLEGLAADGVPAGRLEAELDGELERAMRTAVGFKSIIAYRYGFDFEPAKPTSGEFRAAAENWLAGTGGAAPRVSDPVLLRMLLWKGVETGRPVQVHAGYGDPDLDLHRSNPLLLTSWLRMLPDHASDVMLLHCYPYHREAGYLAQVFPKVFFDVGLAINYTGAMSDRVVAESLELAPFSKILFSTDAWGLPELHHIGAALWRRAMSRVLSTLVADGDWALADARRVATMIGRDNARRVYDLPQHARH